MSTVLVTGSSRGLGLELVKQLSSQAPTEVSLVIAAARKCSPGLESLIQEGNGRVAFVALDISNQTSISQSVQDINPLLEGKGLDVFINCAGVHSWTHGKVDLMADLEYQLAVNVTGAHNAIRSYLPHLQIGKLKNVINISTPFASMTAAQASALAPCPAYKISKAALNALTVQYAMSYKDEGFTFLVVSPGWLKTEMGGEDAHLTVEQGAQAVLDVVNKSGTERNGAFKNIHVPGWDEYKGEDIPW